MNMYHKMTLTLMGALLSVTACATIPPPRNVEGILQTWQWEHIDKLVLSWGPPQRVYPLLSGGQVLEYVRSRTYTRGGGTIPYPMRTYHSGGGSSTTYIPMKTRTRETHLSCFIRIQVTSDGWISSWSFHGNDCKPADK